MSPSVCACCVPLTHTCVQPAAPSACSLIHTCTQRWWRDPALEFGCPRIRHGRNQDAHLTVLGSFVAQFGRIQSAPEHFACFPVSAVPLAVVTVGQSSSSSRLTPRLCFLFSYPPASLWNQKHPKRKVRPRLSVLTPG